MNYPDSYRTLSSIERQATWNKIQGSISHSTEFSPSPYSGSSSLVKKPLLSRDYAIAFLCVLLLSSTTSVAAAADQSLPTSALYAIKLNITEPVRTLTKTTPESRIDWEIERTERRLDETRQLIEQSTLTPEIAREISHQIEKHTDEAQKRIADLSITDSNQGTLLSLSLVETIEKKKEEIIISTEHNLMPDTPAPESVNLSNSETTSDADTTHTELLDPTTDGPTRLSQTESILAILTTADQAQASTDTLIQTISEQAPTPALAINTDSTQQEPEPVPPATDPNVVIFTLVLSDVKNQISKLHTALGTDETVSNPSQLPTVEPTQPQESIDPDAPPSVLPPDTTAVPPLQDTIPEPSTDIEPLQPNVLPVDLPTGTMSLQARLTESANNLTTNEPGTGTESIEVTTITEPTTKDGTDTNFAHPETPINNTDLKPQSSPISLLEEIIASYEALQLISQPTKSDIETARTLRRKAETLLSNQRLKSKNDALQSNTSIDSEILEKISVQSLTISDESTETPAPTQIISSTTIPDSGTTPEQTENLPNTTISPTNSTDKTQ